MTSVSTRDPSPLDPIALASLQRRMRGELLTPDAIAYDAARRVHNQRFDEQPALIACCLSAHDVALAIGLARNQGLEIAVRSGGHSLAGHSASAGGLLIDLSQLNQITIDPLQRIARVQPGATNGQVVQAASAYGLATTTGTCATVGMGGSTLGGGIGWLMGRFGATVDNVLAFEVVTAEGAIITASAREHPDLFWALRGGGGNFGVVTAITYQLHPLGPVLGGPTIFPIAAAPAALRMYREITSGAPDELIAHAVLASILDFGPALLVQAVYSGEDLETGERLLAPLRRLGPAIDLIAPRAYAEAYMMLTPPNLPGAAWCATAYALRQLSGAALDDLLATALERPMPLSTVSIHQVHGAATRVAPDATAFALREPHYAVVNTGMWLAGSGEAETAWAWQAKTRMAPHASSGLYVNFLGDEGERAVREAYRRNYSRLAAIKASYDPDNLFHRNQNIQPS
ncbi:MAG TPA: FAD-binding oxidoreductase [Roseiflexaceae bacterium]|nr:FAD-binding oxidoreductase [Roseiflexaceae bacterium]